MLEDHLKRIFGAFNEAKVRYLIVGGVAVAAHGHPRLTADLDLVVALDRDNTLAAINSLKSLDYRPVAPVEIDEFANGSVRQSWADEKGMQVFQLQSESMPETCIDIFVRAPFDFTREYARAPRMELVEGCTCPVVGFETLVAMKKAAGRPKDLEDVRNLFLAHDLPEKE